MSRMPPPPAKQMTATTPANREETTKNGYHPSPTPASPPDSPFDVNESTSISPASASTTPQPITPPSPRGKRYSRYPKDLGRVPLHRRGNSQTFECLEDLLREAGYKETRVFTPEAERTDHNVQQPDQDKPQETNRGGVIGFLASLVPSTGIRNSILHNSTEPETRVYSPPDSPLAKKHMRSATGDSGPSSPLTGSSYESLDKLSIASAPRRGYSAVQQQPQPSAIQSQPSRAGLYLRHMASAPSIPRLPSSSTGYSRQSRAPAARSARTLLLNDSDTENAPPLPVTWLESVARAVNLSGQGAHTGRPISTTSNTFTTSRHPSSSSGGSTIRPGTLRHTRSSLSQARGISRASTLRSTASIWKHPPSPLRRSAAPSIRIAPPPLCLQPKRPAKGAGATISQMRVVCRSAPGSRATSRVRGEGRAGDLVPSEVGNGLAGALDAIYKGHIAASDEDRGRARGRIPSTSKEKAKPKSKGKGREGSRFLLGNRYLSGWGTDGDFSDEDVGRSESEEEEGELDLAQILVPPKRQHSIQSLRRHLHSGARPRNPHLVPGKGNR